MDVVYNATIAALYREHEETAAMKIAEPKTTPPHCSADTSAAADPAIVSAAAATAHATSAPAASAPAGKNEVGFTLQTLIVMAVFVLAAVGVGIGLLAVNSATSDDFEEAGQTGVEARCAPNEIWDPELESRGIGGPDSQGGVKSKQVGCEPYCGTWEYLSTGANENGEYEPAESPAAARQSSIGGPDGNGGVFSQNIGCFAPCYWEFTWTGNAIQRPKAANVKENRSSLIYYDDNRFPAVQQVRLGVNNRRATADPSTDATVYAAGQSQWATFRRLTDLGNNENHAGNRFQPLFDNKPYIQTTSRSSSGNTAAGGSPLTPALKARYPTVFIPNWQSIGTDPGGTARNGTNWEDENWEVRADPYEKECTIVNITLDDQVVCSSEWDNCGTPRS